MKEFFDVLWEQFLQLNGLEAIAVIFGLLSVWFSMKENILVYPTGIISVVIYIYITFNYKLYADTGINFYYLVASIYGWYFWTNNTGSRTQIKISLLTRTEWLITILLAVVSFALIRFGLDFTDSDVPNWDSVTTTTAIVGMWLMARKKLENWIAWIITDLIAVPLYYYKELYLTSFQFFVFTILATMGYFAWRKTYMAYD
ncbi:MAG: nicotinamide riboside transporter PnuC [Cyclobacteriaceae bacterium]|nr:nicotinamide riboside transporter PnuC [Cyclobacteriaceae bacterium SS2]